MDQSSEGQALGGREIFGVQGWLYLHCSLRSHPGINVQKVCVIFISDTDANTIENKPHDDAVPDLDAVGTFV